MQTAAIRIASLVENGVKDEAGATLPKGIRSGQFIWFSPGPGLGKVRLLQSNRDLAMAQNFSCGAPAVVLCGAAVNPSTTTILIGSQARGATCSGSQVDAKPTGITYSWASSDTSILSIPGSFNLPNVTVNGVGVGTADALGDVEQSKPICSASVQANAKVTPPDHLVVVLDQQGAPPKLPQWRRTPPDANAGGGRARHHHPK